MRQQMADKGTAWKFVQRHAPETSPKSHPELDRLIALAVNYARDFVAPGLKRRAPMQSEATALRELDSRLSKQLGDADPESIQNIFFEIGKTHSAKEALRSWFEALSETLLGSSH